MSFENNKPESIKCAVVIDDRHVVYVSAPSTKDVVKIVKSKFPKYDMDGPFVVPKGSKTVEFVGGKPIFAKK